MKFLSSVKFSIIILPVITTISLIGTFIEPNKAGKFIYHSFWFEGLIVLFSVNISICTIKRLKNITKKNIGFLVTHLSIIIILFGGLLSLITGKKGSLMIYDGHSSDKFFVDKDTSIQLPFTIKLNDFILEYYDESKGALQIRAKGETEYKKYPINVGSEIDYKGAKIKILKYVPDFEINIETHEVNSKSDNPNNPALQIEVSKDGNKKEKWLFAKFPDFHGKDSDDIEASFVVGGGGRIKDFKSELEIIENGNKVLTKTIEVNNPLSYKGYKFYQSSYDDQNLSWSGLQIVKDPGLVFIYIGFVLLIMGVVFIFYIKPML